MRMLTHFSGPNIRSGGDYVTTGVLRLSDVRRSLHSCYAREGNRYVRLTREQLDERRMLCFGPSLVGPSEALPSLPMVGAAAAGESAVGAAATSEAAEELVEASAPPNKRQKMVPVVPCVSIQLASILNEQPPDESDQSQASQPSPPSSLMGSPSVRSARRL
jgi:hypothetical protein